MGVDIYMVWDGKAKEDDDAQITGFTSVGAKGYLRGAYFGGLSDVLRQLFSWANWEANSNIFDAVKFEAELINLKQHDGERPQKGRWDYTKGDPKGWDFSDRQNQPVDSETIKEYDDFLSLGKRLLSEGKTQE